MDRRGAMKSLASVAGLVGLTVSPVTAHGAESVEVVIINSDLTISSKQAEAIKKAWLEAVAGTSIESAKVLVLGSGLKVEFVRGKA